MSINSFVQDSNSECNQRVQLALSVRVATWCMQLEHWSMITYVIVMLGLWCIPYLEIVFQHTGTSTLI